MPQLVTLIVCGCRGSSLDVKRGSIELRLCPTRGEAKKKCKGPVLFKHQSIEGAML